MLLRPSIIRDGGTMAINTLNKDINIVCCSYQPCSRHIMNGGSNEARSPNLMTKLFVQVTCRTHWIIFNAFVEKKKYFSSFNGRKTICEYKLLVSPLVFYFRGGLFILTSLCCLFSNGNKTVAWINLLLFPLVDIVDASYCLK